MVILWFVFLRFFFLKMEIHKKSATVRCPGFTLSEISKRRPEVTVGPKSM